jgi:hypothetical protein
MIAPGLLSRLPERRIDSLTGMQRFATFNPKFSGEFFNPSSAEAARAT